MLTACLRLHPFVRVGRTECEREKMFSEKDPEPGMRKELRHSQFRAPARFPNMDVRLARVTTMPDRDQTNDVELLEGWRNGDSKAFHALYRRHNPAVYRCCRRMLGATGGDDAVSETWLRQHTKVTGDDGYVSKFRSQPYRPYLLRCALNCCSDLWRQNGPTIPLEESVHTAPTQALTLERARAYVDKHRLSARLSEQQAEVLCLSMLGCKGPEIAARLRTTPQTVRDALRWARAKMREYLDVSDE